MKRVKLVRHLVLNGCFLSREGARHSVFHNPQNDQTSTVPRHAEIPDVLVEKICKDLGVPKMKRGK
jgi:mRNA interferase HicA